MKKALQDWRAAVQDGDLDRVRTLFQDHPQLKEHVNDRIFSFDSSAIFHCRDNLPMVDLLLEHGADLNQKTGWWAGGFGILEGVTRQTADPLIERGAVLDIWAAAGLNDLKQVSALLNEDPALVTARGGDGKHPLHYAASVQMVDLLIERGAEVDAKCVDHLSTPAHYLIQNRAVVERLLELGAKTDIFMASYYGDDQLLDQSLEQNPDCCNWRIGNDPWTNEAGGHIYNWTIAHDQTPQDVARDRGHLKLLERLLENAVPSRRLMDAIWDDDFSRIETVMNENPGLLQRLDPDDRESVARAAWWYHPKAVETMLQLGFDPHVPGAHDSTPLDRAAFHGYSDIVGTLLRLDPEPPIHRENEFGGTPLEACLYGFRYGWETGHPQDHLATLELLVNAGAKVTEQHLGRAGEAMDRFLKKHLGAGEH